MANNIPETQKPSWWEKPTQFVRGIFGPQVLVEHTLTEAINRGAEVGVNIAETTTHAAADTATHAATGSTNILQTIGNILGVLGPAAVLLNIGIQGIEGLRALFDKQTNLEEEDKKYPWLFQALIWMLYKREVAFRILNMLCLGLMLAGMVSPLPILTPIGAALFCGSIGLRHFSIGFIAVLKHYEDSRQLRKIEEELNDKNTTLNRRTTLLTQKAALNITVEKSKITILESMGYVGAAGIGALAAGCSIAAAVTAVTFPPAAPFLTAGAFILTLTAAGAVITTLVTTKIVIPIYKAAEKKSEEKETLKTELKQEQAYELKDMPTQQMGTKVDAKTQPKPKQTTSTSDKAKSDYEVTKQAAKIVAGDLENISKKMTSSYKPPINTNHLPDKVQKPKLQETGSEITVGSNKPHH